MEQVLYNAFFDEQNGFFFCIRDGVSWKKQKEKTGEVLAEINNKIKRGDITNSELRVFMAIVVELATNSHNREISDYFSEFQILVPDAFMTLDLYNKLRGE